MAEIRRTTIPQFSIKGLLFLTAVMAVVSLAVSQALRAQPGLAAFRSDWRRSCWRLSFTS